MKLISIGDGHSLIENAGQSILRAFRDGAPRQTINSSTRSYSQQYDWYVNRGKTGYPVYVEHPNTSKHVYRPGQIDEGARALDVNDPLRNWLVTRGSEYGWRRTISHEPWHFEYFVNLDTKRFLPPPPPITPIDEEDIMATLAELEAVVGKQNKVMRIPGTSAEWLDLGNMRRWITAQQSSLYKDAERALLDATDKFWLLPIVSGLKGIGEIYRKPGTAEAYAFIDGELCHVTVSTYNSLVPRPTIKDVALTNPLWTLPLGPAL